MVIGTLFVDPQIDMRYYDMLFWAVDPVPGIPYTFYYSAPRLGELTYTYDDWE